MTRQDGDASQTAADDALQSLVQQFSERSAFVRELVQNALDAGSGSVEVNLCEQRGCLKVDVVDDGEGMDRDIIEKYLLTLFRSSKEKDLTKIGKFGVGFVSLFALNPELVVVNTARDGVSYRVVFDEKRAYTLAEVDEPFEGTTVTLYVRGDAAARRALAKEVREAIHYWCRYTRAEVWTHCEASWGWAPEQVRHDFGVDAPVQVSVEEDGLRAVLGFTHSPVPVVGYYNHGLTLLEAREDTIPGVTFRVEARILEHTLTRDNVIRDRNFRAVIRRLEALARGPLRKAHQEALQHAIVSEDWDQHAALLAVAHHKIVGLPPDLPCLRAADGSMVSISALKPRLLKRLFSTELLYAEGPSPLAQALVADGRMVLLGGGKTSPDIALATHLGLGEPLDIHERWILPEVLQTGPLVKAVAEGIGELPPWRACLPARFTDRGDAIVDRLVSWQGSPGSLEHRTMADAEAPVPHRATILINIEHPVFVSIKAVDPKIAAPLLRHACKRALGLAQGLSPQELRQALAGAGRGRGTHEHRR